MPASAGGHFFRRVRPFVIGRWLWLSVLLLLLISALTLPASASEAEGAVDSLLSGIPEDIAALLPRELWEAGAEGIGEVAAEISRPGRLLALVGRLLAADLPGALSLFARLLGLLVLSALFGAVRDNIRSGPLGSAASLLTVTVITGALLGLVGQALTLTEAFLTRLSTFTTAMIPAMAALYAMGGNVATAAVANSGMMMFLGVIEALCTKTLGPVAGMSAALAVAGCLFGEVNLRGLVGFIKKVYTFFLGLLMTVLTFGLGLQTLLSAGADSLAMKGARMLAGRAIPVVGGAVGDTFRTLAAGVGYLKTSVGAVGLVVLALMIAPPLLTVLLYRLGLIAAVSAADILGCSRESRLLDAFVTLFGYLLAVMSVVSVTLVLLIVLFVRCSVAVG